MAKEEKVPCEQGTLGEDMQRLTWELIDSLEGQLKKQQKQGLPVEQGLKSLRKAKRTLRRVLGR